MADVTVTHHPDDHVFVARVDGERAGELVDHVRQGRHLLVHTGVDDAFGGQGVGAALVRAAFDAARAAGEQVVPICPYVAHWLDKHPEERDLVDEELTARLTD